MKVPVLMLRRKRQVKLAPRRSGGVEHDVTLATGPAGFASRPAGRLSSSMLTCSAVEGAGSVEEYAAHEEAGPGARYMIMIPITRT